MSEDSQEIEIKNPLTNEVVKYTMKLSLWIDDMADQARLVTAKGLLDAKALWICRLSKALGKTDSEIMKMHSWQMTNLIVHWIRLNDVNEVAFLEAPKPEKSSTVTTSTS